MKCVGGVKSLCLLTGLATLVSVMAAQAVAGRTGDIVSALRNRDFDRALALLRPALTESPKSAQLWAFQGLAYSGKGDQKAGLASYKSALKIAPDYLPALEGAAQLEYDAGNAEAIPLLQRVLRLRPNETTSHAMLAVLAYKKHDCVTAVQHFAQSGTLVESQPGALQMYGSCLMNLRQTDKALPVFQKMLAFHPDDSRRLLQDFGGSARRHHAHRRVPQARQEGGAVDAHELGRRRLRVRDRAGAVAHREGFEGAHREPDTVARELPVSSRRRRE